MTQLDFVTISQALDKMDIPECDIVVGIGSGGAVPAALVADRLGCNLAMIYINYRDTDNVPIAMQPQHISSPKLPDGIDSVLLVDDVVVSGKTLEFAKTFLTGYKITTLSLKGSADYVLFPEIKDCVAWPWKPSQ